MNSRTALWAHLLRLTWRTSPGRASLIILTLVADVAGAPFLALALRDFTNALIRRDFGAALIAAVAAALLRTVASQSSGLRQLLRNEVGERVGLVVTQDVLRRLTGVPGIGHLEDPASLDRADAATRKSHAVADVLWIAAEIVASVLSVAAALLVLAIVSPTLLLILPLVVPMLVLNRIGGARIQRAAAEAAEAQRTADNLLAMVLDPVAAIELRVTGAGSALLKQYEAQWQHASTIAVRAQRHAAILLIGGWTIFMLGFAGCLAFTVWQISIGHASIGDILLVLSVTRQLQISVEATVSGFSRMIDGLHAADSYLWLWRHTTAATESTESVVAPARLTEGIVLDRVSFGYPGSSRPVLRDITLDLPAGAVVALVGTHGSGKTTLIKLLTRMYSPSGGEIRVDGTPLGHLDPARWRARVTCGFQDFTRFHTTVRESVGIGDLPKARDDRQIWRSIEQAGAGSVVKGLPADLATRLGATFDGVELSGGQWQKIALARTCMRDDPLLVVLDEPTASLDPVSEHDVFQRQAALARDMGQRYGTVTVIVSHRFSTVRMADKIVVLSGGSILEVGDHASLMAAGGRYAQLYRLQQDSYAGS